jgi:uncharacterized protein (TIGR03435 family)
MRQAVLASFVGAITGIGVLSGSTSTAQQPQQAKPLEFEVATVKPSAPNAVGSLIQGGPPGGQYRMVSVPLKRWVEIGLSVPDYALRAPSWLDTSRFDLNARVPADHGATPEMMKALLIERFGLKWHEELSTVSGFELVPDKKVLVQPATLLERLAGAHGSASGPALIQGTNAPMSEIAEALGKVLGRPVVDATHLSGGFDFKLMWRPDGDATVAEWKRHGIDVDNLPDSVLTAVREQLGLRLQSAKVPSKVMVVDHINSHPTEN